MMFTNIVYAAGRINVVQLGKLENFKQINIKSHKKAYTNKLTFRYARESEFYIEIPGINMHIQCIEIWLPGLSSENSKMIPYINVLY